MFPDFKYHGTEFLHADICFFISFDIIKLLLSVKSNFFLLVSARDYFEQIVVFLELKVS